MKTASASSTDSVQGDLKRISKWDGGLDSECMAKQKSQFNHGSLGLHEILKN
jgi:hypothetical protein